MSIIMISDKPAKDYEEWLGKSLEVMAGYKIRGIAVCCLLEPEEEDSCLCGYYNMGQADKAEASAHILFDSVDHMIRSNLARYAEMVEHGEPETGGDERK